MQQTTGSEKNGHDQGELGRAAMGPTKRRI